MLQALSRNVTLFNDFGLTVLKNGYMNEVCLKLVPVLPFLLYIFVYFQKSVLAPLIDVGVGIDITGTIPDMPPDSESPAATRRPLPPPPELAALLPSEQHAI